MFDGGANRRKTGDPAVRFSGFLRIRSRFEALQDSGLLL
jgi:hypothetical protein